MKFMARLGITLGCTVTLLGGCGSSDSTTKYEEFIKDKDVTVATIDLTVRGENSYSGTVTGTLIGQQNGTINVTIEPGVDIPFAGRTDNVKWSIQWTS
jgi:hypothetical protein